MLFKIITVTIGLINNIYVPDDYPSIQEAINNASNGDTITIRANVYNENLNLLGKGIILTSEDPNNFWIKTHTIIDGSDLNSSVVTCSSFEDSNTKIRGLTIQNGTFGTSESGVTRGGGIYCRLAGPTIENCVIVNNKSNFGGGVGVYYGWPVLYNNIFINNTSTLGGNWGGGAIGNRGGELYIGRCIVKNNQGITGAYGGGLSTIGGSVKICNSLFVHNSAYVAGAIFNSNGELNIINTTIAYNNSNNFVNGILSSNNGARTNIYNSILWHLNSGSTIDLYDSDGSTSYISYSNISTNWNGQGDNIINENPHFISPLEDNFFLEENSLCINFGNINVISEELDLIGYIRIIDNVDLGCYELNLNRCDGDFDLNNIVNFNDLVLLLNNWNECWNCVFDLNHDQWVDFDDLLILINNMGPC